MKSHKFALTEQALLILLAGVSLLSLQLWIQHGFAERLWVDEAEYAWYAHRIAENPSIIFSREIINTHPPLFPVILAFGNIFGRSLNGCRFITILISFSGIGLIYALGKKLFNATVGFLSAVLLAINSAYVKFSPKILIDGLLMTVMMWLAIELIHARRSADPHSGFKVGAVGCVAILLKWSALLVIPFIVMFYVLDFDSLGMKQRIKNVFPPLRILLAVVLGLFVNNYLQLGRVWGNVSAVTVNTSQNSSVWFYWMDLPSLLNFPFALFFCAAGVFFSWKEDRRVCLLLVIWFLVFVAAFSLAAEKITRYSLAYLPALLILLSFGMYRSAQSIFPSSQGKQLANVMIVLYVCGYAAFSYPDLASMLREENRFYTGFYAAAQEIKKAATPDTLIVASSPDLVRYYTGIEFKKFGGQIVYWPFKPEDREALLEDHPGPMIIVLDNWGRPYNLLVDPFNPLLLRSLRSEGFREVATMSRMRYYSSKGQSRVFPAIWIMRRFMK
ncbi:MAG: glycosyltransferase family 39 protein [Candidatus Omnitrophota bacterium]|jgi:4-amino-4-deoxy-L-arabinose transferase-like glycosyltransferase